MWFLECVARSTVLIKMYRVSRASLIKVHGMGHPYGDVIPDWHGWVFFGNYDRIFGVMIQQDVVIMMVW